MMEKVQSGAVCICAVSAMALSGCASVSPQEAGYVIGAIAGGAVASVPGAAAGAMVGTAVGSLIARPIERAQQEKERHTLEQQLNGPPGSAPAVTATALAAAPTDVSHPQRIWIDEQVVSGRVIPGHFDTQYVPERSIASVASASASDATLPSSHAPASAHE